MEPKDNVNLKPTFRNNFYNEPKTLRRFNLYFEKELIYLEEQLYKEKENKKVKEFRVVIGPLSINDLLKEVQKFKTF